MIIIQLYSGTLLCFVSCVMSLILSALCLFMHRKKSIVLMLLIFCCGAMWTAGTMLAHSSDPTKSIVFVYQTYSRFLLLGGIVPFLLLLCLVVIAARLLVRVRQEGFCSRCEYDLRGNPDGDSCPECGWGAETVSDTDSDAEYWQIQFRSATPGNALRTSAGVR